MRESNRLTAKFVEQVKTPGIYRDGGGLLLRVEISGSKRWVLRTSVRGKRCDVGLGSAKSVLLAEARDEAHQLRRMARRGQDLIAVRREARSSSPTFEQAAQLVHDQRTRTWRNSKHSAQWLSTLRTYAFPVIGRKSVAEVQSADVLRVLSPIWLTKPETARRVRQRIRVILNWAVTAGHRSHLTVNAADAVGAGLPRQKAAVRHHPAMPWRQIPRFLHSIRRGSSDESVRLALEFLVLTAARTGEVLGASVSEINLRDAIWTVPAGRMKSGQADHRVPLSKRAIEIVQDSRVRWPNSKVLFPTICGTKPLSNMALLMLMRRLGRKEVPHGFRSSFRDWVAETDRNSEHAEAALSHSSGSKVVRAYRRTDFLEARRALMTDWARFVSGDEGT
jgi:integrase